MNYFGEAILPNFKKKLIVVDIYRINVKYYFLPIILTFYYFSLNSLALKIIPGR